MAQFTRLAAAIAAATLAGAVHAEVEVTMGGEVDFAFEYHNSDAKVDGDGNPTGESRSSVYLDTAELTVEATDGTTTAGLTAEFQDGGDDDTLGIDNAYLEYKINDNYTAFGEYDDTVIGLQGESMMWNDSFHKNAIYDHTATMVGVKIKGGPISSTLYLTQGESGDDDLHEFGTSVDYTADMFSAHFGYVSDVLPTGSEVGAFSFGGTATLNNILLIAEYVMLSDEVNDADPTFLQLEANYEMNGYTLGAAYFMSDEADDAFSGSSVDVPAEDRIALSVAKHITDML